MTKPTVLAALTAPAVAAAGFCFGRKLSQVWRRGRSTPRPDVPSLSFSEAVHLSGIDDARRYLTERELEVYVGEAYRNGDEAADEYLRTVSLQRCTEVLTASSASRGYNPLSMRGHDPDGEVMPARQNLEVRLPMG